ncbi:pinin [Halyomorpha halys]|uniref:pinin n=1 Tax=Halyomorpha halys TaxID=286706 RepID=UPI0006D50B8B|nr:pinin [Halyomorpha halys]
MQTSILTIQNELEKARERLKGVEDNIKKSIGRDINSGPPISRAGFKRTARHLDSATETPPVRPRFQNESIKSRLGDFIRNTEEPRSREHDFRGRINRRLSATDTPRIRKVEKTEERVPAKKRLGEQPAVTVFSRLSGPPKDDDFEEKESVKITSQVIVQDAPSRKEVLAAQNGDNQSKARNRRMFGALLGTLQKFRQEENRLKEKEDKRAQVEKKLEEAALREKEELKKKRQELFSSRRQQQIEIRQLEFKLLRLKQLTEWESTKKHLLNFIQTKSTPKIFYLPKIHNDKSKELLEESSKHIERMIEEKRAEVEKAIADHAATKKDDREGIHDEEEPREEEEEEEEEGEVRDENSKAPVERMDIEEVVEKDNLNGVSDKENDVEEESMIDDDQKIESSPNPEPQIDIDIEETT